MNPGAGRIFLSYGIPGLVLLALAFWAGSQQDPTLGMLGFVSFFMGGMFLLIHGYQKVFGPAGKNGDENERSGT